MGFTCTPSPGAGVEDVVDEVHPQRSEFLSNCSLAVVRGCVVNNPWVRGSLYSENSRGLREVFSAAYPLRRTSQDVRYFVTQGGCDKLIVNMVDIDHSMREIVVRITGQWEAELEGERGAVPTTWNLCPPAGGSVALCRYRGKDAEVDSHQL